MKTLQEVLKRMSELEEPVTDLIAVTAKKTKFEKRAAKELKLLTSVRNFLETSPSEEFVKSEIKRLNQIIIGKNNTYEYWKINVAPKNLDKESQYTSLFKREMGLGKISRQLKMLKFILS
jgi:hypothetical protein